MTVLARLRGLFAPASDDCERGIAPGAALPGSVEADVVVALESVLDPEVGLNVVDLGLVYGIHVDPIEVVVTMTMTTPACPLGELIRARAAEALERALPDLKSRVCVVWDPPWSPSFITRRGRDWLGL